VVHADDYVRLLQGNRISEPSIILKDIWGLSDREVERTALWSADALIAAALLDAGKPG